MQKVVIPLNGHIYSIRCQMLFFFFFFTFNKDKIALVIQLLSLIPKLSHKSWAWNNIRQPKKPEKLHSKTAPSSPAHLPKKQSSFSRLTHKKKQRHCYHMIKSNCPLKLLKLVFHCLDCFSCWYRKKETSLQDNSDASTRSHISFTRWALLQCCIILDWKTFKRELGIHH